jgi:xanthine/uracil permease
VSHPILTQREIGGKMSYTDWLQKRWYIAIIIIGIAAALAQLFISRYSVTIGLLVGYAISYVIELFLIKK